MLESSIMLLENIYSTGITHDDNVEWMTEFQPAARIATWRPWNKQVVSEVTSW
jgi:hypothetical protein